MDPHPQTPSPRNSQNPVPTRDNLTTSLTPQRAEHREAAINLVRGELDNIYGGNSGIAAPHTTPVAAVPVPNTRAEVGAQMAAGDESPYSKTHTAPEMSHTEQWKQYHSAWQDYYRKYYEQYYVKAVATQMSNTDTPKPSHQATSAASDQSDEDTQQGLTREEALFELRQDIMNRAQTSAKKVRKSRHFVPIAAALAVVGMFALLQYNQVLVANVKAYVSPGAIEPQNIIVDPNSDVPVGPETKMIIPKINVDAPVVMGVGPTNEDQLKAMANGIAHVKYPGAVSDPGQIGNAVFSAHSSSDWTDAGAYKFIFVQLERMAVDDVVYINYQSKRYTYKVYDIKEVKPTDVAALNYTGSDPVITLITCTPLGTAQKRLLVFAKQISPDPSAATQAAPQAASQTTTEIPGTSPTFLERLFGAN